MAAPTPTYYSGITWTLGSSDELQVGVPNAADAAAPRMQYCLYDNPDGWQYFSDYVSDGANLPKP